MTTSHLKADSGLETSESGKRILKNLVENQKAWHWSTTKKQIVSRLLLVSELNLFSLRTSGIRLTNKPFVFDYQTGSRPSITILAPNDWHAENPISTDASITFRRSTCLCLPFTRHVQWPSDIKILFDISTRFTQLQISSASVKSPLVYDVNSRIASPLSFRLAKVNQVCLRTHVWLDRRAAAAWSIWSTSKIQMTTVSAQLTSSAFIPIEPRVAVRGPVDDRDGQSSAQVTCLAQCAKSKQSHHLCVFKLGWEITSFRFPLIPNCFAYLGAPCIYIHAWRMSVMEEACPTANGAHYTKG